MKRRNGNGGNGMCGRFGGSAGAKRYARLLVPLNSKDVPVLGKKYESHIAKRLSVSDCRCFYCSAHQEGRGGPKLRFHHAKQRHNGASLDFASKCSCMVYSGAFCQAPDHSCQFDALFSASIAE